MKRRTILGGVVAAFALMPVVSAAQAEPLKIAIANFGEHPQLNEAAEAFRQEIVASGLKEGEDVTFTVDHVNFDTTLLPQMIAKINASSPDLVFALTTPVAQNVLNALGSVDYPLVFGAVTDPVAAGLVPSWDKGGERMSGASDGLDSAATLKFAEQLFPEAATFGFPYNPGEANDVAMLDDFRAAAEGSRFSIVDIAIDNTNEIPARVTALARQADVIYVPTSNLIQPAISAVAASANEARIPILNSDDGPVRDGIVPAAFSVSYDQVGRNAAKIALRALDGTPISEIPPSRPAFEDHQPTISRPAMQAVGAKIPGDLEGCDCIVD